MEATEKSFNDNRKDEFRSQSEEYLFTLKCLNSQLQSNTHKVAYTLKKGRTITDRISSIDLKADIEEFSEKWEDVSSHVSLALEEEKNVSELSHEFENSSQEIDAQIDTIQELIIQIEEQMQTEENVNFQNIVQRQSSVYHIKQRFYSQENLKKSVLKIGDQLLKTKRYNLTQLNRQLCFLENKWEGIGERIRDLEELSMNPVFLSDSMEIPMDEILSLVMSIEHSLDKCISDTKIQTLSDVETMADQLKYINLKLGTIQPLVDLYCQRIGGSESDRISDDISKQSRKLHSLIDQCTEISAIMKTIEEQVNKVSLWTSLESINTIQLVKSLFSIINVKIGITKIKVCWIF